MKSRFYMVRLFFAGKFLFLGVLLFILLNLAANFIFKTEHTPIFLWNLYSGQIPQKKVYSFFEIRYNNNELLLFPHTWDEPQKLFFTNTLNHFILMKRNNNIDPYKAYIDYWNKNHPSFKRLLPGVKFYNDTTELNEFPSWYKRYLEQHLNKPVYKIDVYEIEVAFMKNGETKKLSSTLIYKLL